MVIFFWPQEGRRISSRRGNFSLPLLFRCSTLEGSPHLSGLNFLCSFFIHLFSHKLLLFVPFRAFPLEDCATLPSLRMFIGPAKGVWNCTVGVPSVAGSRFLRRTSTLCSLPSLSPQVLFRPFYRVPLPLLFALRHVRWLLASAAFFSVGLDYFISTI